MCAIGGILNLTVNEDTIDKIKPKQKNKKAAIAIEDEAITEQQSVTQKRAKVERPKKKVVKNQKIDDLMNMQIDLLRLNMETLSLWIFSTRY
mgnify:CR=1 FL=1